MTKKRKPYVECPMSYLLLYENGNQASTGECKGRISKEYLTVLPKFGDILPFHFRIIKEIQAEDYRVTLSLFSKETLVLSKMGYCYEDFQRVLKGARNEVIIKDLLMNEVVKKSDVDMEFFYYDKNDNESQKGPGKIRLYETGLVVLPQNGEFLRVPYSDIIGVSEHDYSIKIDTETGGHFVFQKLGSEFDRWVKAFSEIMNELQSKAVSSAKALFPGIDSISLRKIAALMKEGKAVSRSDIEAVNSKLWQEMEKKIAEVGLNDYYTFLKELGCEEKTAVGFKRGLMGDLTGEYIWFLMPIYGTSEKEYGNAIALEAAEKAGQATPSETAEDPATIRVAQNPTTDETLEAGVKEGTGRATYFFRIVNREEYQNIQTPQQFDSAVDTLIKTISRGMLDINFRREPIYIPDEKLDEAAYTKYKIAIQKIPSLQILRGLYVGRIIHNSPEQWKNDVMALLRFNTATQNDLDKWEKDSD